MGSDASVQELERRVARLADEEAIRCLLFEFAAASDGQDFDRLPELFTRDVVVEHPKGAAHGRAEFIPQLRGALEQHFTSHHMITNIRIALAGDRARVVGYFHSVHLDDPLRPDQHEDHGGWYLAEVVRSAAGWQIDRLKQVSVWSAENRRPTGPLDARVLEELRDHLADAVPSGGRRG
jgi:ketosteroid isomerase-like protein